MASMNNLSATRLIKPIGQWIDRRVIRTDAGPSTERLTRWAASGIVRDLRQWGVSESVYERAASEYMPVGASPLDDLPADGPRYTRKTWGTCTLDTLKPECRNAMSRWSHIQNAALYWTDGQRTLEAIKRLVAAETGSTASSQLDQFFELCLDAGVMTVR